MVVSPALDEAHGMGHHETQRAAMRRIYRREGMDHGRTVRAYAAAEGAGDVERRSNENGLSAEDYAYRLLADGLTKGWIDR